MLQRIKNKINREIKKRGWDTIPHVPHLTHTEPKNQWYEPVLAGPQTFIKTCTATKTIEGVLRVLQKLSSDPYLEFLKRYYEKGLNTFGEKWCYADINTVLYGITSLVPISSYLEIGVRRGRSMAMVAFQRPECNIVGFDLWIKNYAGMENPGSEFVKTELENLHHRGSVEFIDGDSKQTVPGYFVRNKEVYFDLITVDGDHSAFGAKADLNNTLNRLKIGGILVFDDIMSYEHPHLGKVWNTCVKAKKQFATYEFTELGLGVAFAIRRF